MVRVIDLNESGLTTEQVIESVQNPEGAILRQGGKVIARIQPADEIDLDDELWAHAPEQITRGEQARQRAARGETLHHDDVKRQLDNEAPRDNGAD